MKAHCEWHKVLVEIDPKLICIIFMLEKLHDLYILLSE